MMPTRLNLLLPEKRKTLRFMVNMQYGLTILQFVVIALCLIGITLLVSQSILDVHIGTISKNYISPTTQLTETDKTIRAINADIKTIQSIQSDALVVTPILHELFSIIPSSVQLKTFSFNPKERTLALSGVARDRESLLALQSSLESLSYIESIDIPIALLLQKEFIPFSFTLPLHSL